MQAASLSGQAMTRNVLVVVGAALLSFGGIGLIVGLSWITANHLNGLLIGILDGHSEALLFLLPALLLTVSIVGAAFMAAALSTPTREERTPRHLRTHTHFHAWR